MPGYNPKIYTLIAGVNGAGKSTYYSIMEKNTIDELGFRINYDELQKKYKNDIRAGKESVRLVRECLKSDESFHQETTLY